MARQSSARTASKTAQAQRGRTGKAAPSKRGAPARQPITRHPLFPAIVALWFGALFGLGSLAIRTSLIESLVLRAKLDLVVPAAAPPLGLTARILLSLGLAVLGAVIGTVLGRMIGRPRKVVTGRSRKVGAKPENRARIVEVDEFEEDDEADLGFAAPRRRALTVDDDYEEEFHREFAPLPGGTPQILDVTEFDFTGDVPERATPAPVEPKAFGTPVSSAAPEETPAALDLSGFLNVAEPEPVPMRQVFNPAPVAATTPAPVPTSAPVTGQVIEAQPAPTPAPFASPADKPLAAPAAPVHAPATEVAPPMAHLDLINRLAESMRQRRAAASAETAVAAPLPESDSPLGIFARPKNLADEPAAPPASATLPRLDTRLDLHGDPASTQAEAAPETSADPFAGSRDSGDIVAPPVSLPAALRPLSFDDPADDDDEETLSAVLPPRHFSFVQPEAAGPAPSAEELTDEGAPEAVDEEALDDGYSSLLDLSRPSGLRQSFVRIEEPVDEANAFEPTVQFPGATPFAPPPAGFAAEPSVPDFTAPPASTAAADPFAPPPFSAPSGNMRRFDAPTGGGPLGGSSSTPGGNALDAEETERALRTALATLQRMSARG